MDIHNLLRHLGQIRSSEEIRADIASTCARVDRIRSEIHMASTLQVLEVNREMNTLVSKTSKTNEQRGVG